MTERLRTWKNGIILDLETEDDAERTCLRENGSIVMRIEKPTTSKNTTNVWIDAPKSTDLGFFLYGNGEPLGIVDTACWGTTDGEITSRRSGKALAFLTPLSPARARVWFHLANIRDESRGTGCYDLTLPRTKENTEAKIAALLSEADLPREERTPAAAKFFARLADCMRAGEWWTKTPEPEPQINSTVWEKWPHGPTVRLLRSTTGNLTRLLTPVHDTILTYERNERGATITIDAQELYRETHDQRIRTGHNRRFEVKDVDGELTAVDDGRTLLKYRRIHGAGAPPDYRDVLEVQIHLANMLLDADARIMSWELHHAPVVELKAEPPQPGPVGTYNYYPPQTPPTKEAATTNEPKAETWRDRAIRDPLL